MNTLFPMLSIVNIDSVVVEGASSGNWLLTAVCLVLGLFNLFCPYAAWYLTRRWWFQDMEPSDLALTLTRVGGVVCILIGIVYLFI